MTNEEIDNLWHKAMRAAVEKGDDFTRFEFANLIKQHLIESGYRRCAEGQRTTQYCCMVEEAVKEEREACEKVCESIGNKREGHSIGYRSAAWECAAAIRERGET